MADRIRDLLEEFATRIKEAALEEAFESLKSAMGGGAAPTRRGPGRPKGSGARATRVKVAKRDPKELDALVGKLHTAIRSKPGQRIEEIARAMGTTTKELALPAKKLIAAKKIKTTGNRRATKYLPM